jgi:hypothetical protein
MDSGAEGASLVNRADLQELTKERILDAKALIRGKRWSFAYYVSGYAIECALKSCLLARMIHTGWVFQDGAKLQDCLTHDFDKLIRLSGLTTDHNARLAASSTFATNWNRVDAWAVTDRYVATAEDDARTLYAAITDKADGVFPWIMKYW